ncbi:MAG: polysaccharide pyruvyl transferase family protein [Cryomorphaceae bacterium]|nr:polysaccharide pyruvyl transferase family protein [Flavobacteriales bacterium]
MDVIELQVKLKGILKKLLPDQKVPLALVDFPNYLNVGDNAIWLGEIDLLKELGFEINYICTVSSYNKAQLKKALQKNGVILLQGGGNFGDLWMRHENLRRNVIQDFPDHQIIQLPQSIHYANQTELDLSTEILNNHPNLTLLARDLKSFAFAKENFKSSSFLCPDMAFGIKLVSKSTSPPKYDILWLIRGDKETKNNAFQLQVEDRNEAVSDWSSGYHSQLDTFCSVLFRLVKKFPSSHTFTHALLLRAATRAARMRMNYGVELLSQSKSVVTDRLHGHIICFLLGIPHIAMDNSYGKVSGFIKTWGTGDEKFSHFASDGKEARRLSEKLVGNF